MLLGKVPALELPSGKVLYESLIIAEYLDEEYPTRPLYDKQPVRKALDRILINRFDEVFMKKISSTTISAKRHH